MKWSSLEFRSGNGCHCNVMAEMWGFLCGLGLDYGSMWVKYLMLSLCGDFVFGGHICVGEVFDGDFVRGFCVWRVYLMK